MGSVKCALMYLEVRKCGNVVACSHAILQTSLALMSLFCRYKRVVFKAHNAQGESDRLKEMSSHVVIKTGRQQSNVPEGARSHFFPIQ